MSLAGQLRRCGDCVGNVNISRHAGVSLTTEYADVVELVDTHALGACASRREGSSPFIRTKTWVVEGFLRSHTSITIKNYQEKSLDFR